MICRLRCSFKATINVKLNKIIPVPNANAHLYTYIFSFFYTSHTTIAKLITKKHEMSSNFKLSKFPQREHSSLI